MKTLKQVWESSTSQHQNTTKAYFDAEDDTEVLSTPEPVGKITLDIGEEAEDFLDQAPNKKEAIQYFQSLNNDIVGFLSTGLRSIGADRKTAELVAAAFVSEYIK